DNDYSVPMEYAYQDVVIKGYTDHVKICRCNEVIAVHQRCWDRQKQIFNPLHYLPLLERKPHSLPFARPFEQLFLPGCFDVLQSRMESELEHGTREYIKVLRLLEKYPIKQLTLAVEKTLRSRLHTVQAIEQFLPGSPDHRRTIFTLDGHKHLRLVQFSKANPADYNDLLQPGGVA
ncbi:MAG: IS21 family transposase, partial [Planctomycetes bacterium]|nr:IS21 family transposase [Planctomycetota bacterium]